MNKDYKYCVTENTKNDHCDTWFKTLDEARNWFNKHLNQYILITGGLYDLCVLSSKDDKILQHCMLSTTATGEDSVFVDMILREV